MAGSGLLQHLKIGLKLPLVMVLIGASALLFGKIMATGHARKAIVLAGEERLTAVAESRAEELHAALERVAASLRGEAASPVVGDAIRAFSIGWDILGQDAPERVRQLYLHENPYAAEGRFSLEDAGDSSSYTRVHRRYQSYFVSLLTGLEYSDVLLISPGGIVLHSTAKSSYLGRDLSAGRESRGSLAEAYLKVVDGSDPSGIVMTDFAFDPLTPGAVEAVFATALKGSLGRFEGVLAVKVPQSVPNAIMERPEGLGMTGQAFLLGADGMLRTATRQSSPPILRDGFDAAPPVKAVLSGRRGVLRHQDDAGDAVVSAFVPMRMSGFDFGVIAQQSEVEILAPARAMGKRINEDGLFGIVFVSVVGLILARSMSVPLARVGEAMDRVARKDYESRIPDLARRDEIGDIARRLDVFSASLVEADVLARENAFKGAAFASASAALMIVDRDLMIIYANNALATMLERRSVPIRRQIPGFCSDELPGRSLVSLFPRTDRLLDCLKNGDHAREHLRFGQVCLSVDMGTVARDDGSVIGYVVEWRDVSADEPDRAILELVDGSLPVAFFSKDGRLTGANNNFKEWVQTSQGDLTGSTWDKVFAGQLGFAADKNLETGPGDSQQGVTPNWTEIVSQTNCPGAQACLDFGIETLLVRQVGGIGGQSNSYVVICAGIASPNPGKPAHVSAKTYETSEQKRWSAAEPVSLGVRS